VSWSADRGVLAARLLLAAAALAAGLAVGWAASGRFAVVASLAIVIAAANGYSKAHSP
jgi:hypothetical protein